MKKKHYAYYESRHRRSGEICSVLRIGQTTLDLVFVQNILDQVFVRAEAQPVITVGNRTTNITIPRLSSTPKTETFLKRAALMALDLDLDDGTWTRDPAPAEQHSQAAAKPPQHKQSYYPVSKGQAPHQERSTAANLMALL